MPRTRSKKRGPSYSKEEVDTLLCIVYQKLPIGQDDWDGVYEEHLSRWPDTDRDVLSLRRKFNQLANKKVPTGDPNCPPHVREAKQILFLIKEEADMLDMEDSSKEEEENNDEENQKEVEQDEKESDNENEEDPTAEIVEVDEDKKKQEEAATVGKKKPPTPVTDGFSTDTSAQPRARRNKIRSIEMSPNLRRVSNRQGRRGMVDDMSLQDFMKFSMMQREEDRREREERERIRQEEMREQRRRREDEDRMFRHLMVSMMFKQHPGPAINYPDPPASPPATTTKEPAPNLQRQTANLQRQMAKEKEEMSSATPPESDNNNINGDNMEEK